MGSTVLDGKEEDVDERVCLSANCISVDIFYAFLDFTQFSGNDDTVEGRIIRFSCPDVWIATVLTRW